MALYLMEMKALVDCDDDHEAEAYFRYIERYLRAQGTEPIAGAIGVTDPELFDHELVASVVS